MAGSPARYRPSGRRCSEYGPLFATAENPSAC